MNMTPTQKIPVAATGEAEKKKNASPICSNRDFQVIWAFGVLDRVLKLKGEDFDQMDKSKITGQQSSTRTALWPSRPQRLIYSRRRSYIPSAVRKKGSAVHTVPPKIGQIMLSSHQSPNISKDEAFDPRAKVRNLWIYSCRLHKE